MGEIQRPPPPSRVPLAPPTQPRRSYPSPLPTPQVDPESDPRIPFPRSHPQVDHVTVPDDANVMRFTDDGRYLICVSRNQRELVVYRYVGGRGGGSKRAAPPAGRGRTPPAEPQAPSGDPAPADDGTGTGTGAGTADDTAGDNDPRRRAEDAFAAYFEHAFSRPLVMDDADLLSKDFALTVLDGDYVIVASSTQPEVRTDGDGEGGHEIADAGAAAAAATNAPNVGAAVRPPRPAPDAADAATRGAAAVERAREEGAAARDRLVAAGPTGVGGVDPGGRTVELPASPVMQIVAFHLVRLRDGKLCDRVVFRDDYIRLKRAQGLSAVRVSADATLLTVLSLRRQAFHVLRCERRRRRNGAGAGGTAGGGSRRRWGAFDGVTQGFGGGEGLVDDGRDGGGDTAGDSACEELAPPVSPDEETAGFVVVRPPIGARCEPDDDVPLRAQDAAEARWRERRREAESDADDEGDEGDGNIRRETSGTSDRVPMPSGASHPSMGWSDPRSPMYTGLKQKVMTRAFLEARRRDNEEWQLYAADAAVLAVEEERLRRNRVPRGFLDQLGWGPGHDSGLHGGGVSSYGHGRAARDGAGSDDGEGDGGPGGSQPKEPPAPEPGNYGIAAGKKRKRASSSFSFPVGLPRAGLGVAARLERPRNRHVSAFRSRYWYYAEWMCAWHCGFLDAGHVAVRMGTADDVLAWGRRATNGRGGAAGGGDYNRCPATVLVAVVRLSDGAVVHVGDLRGEGGGLLGVESSSDYNYRGDAGEGKRANIGGGIGVEWPFGEEPPPAEGTEWARLAPCTASAPRLPATCAVGPARSRTGPGSSGAARFEWPKTPPLPAGHWCASPYLDPALFDFDRRAIAPDERPRGASELSLRFSAPRAAVARVRARVDRDAARQVSDKEPESYGKDGDGDGDDDDAWLNALVGGRGIKSLRFKLPPSAGAAATQRMKRSVSHMFHPVFPFAMSVSHAFMHPQVVSFHFRE